jgi:hypothetical protein
MTEPTHEETTLQVTVLGRAVGESVVVRFGGLGWLVVDSFVSRRRAAPLRYIEHVGGDPADIRWVCATHWHNDHVKGLSEVLAAAGTDATFFSPAISDPKRLARVIAAAETAAADSTEELDFGADSFGLVLEELDNREEPLSLTAARSFILRRGGVAVSALSPTAWALHRGQASVSRDLVTEPAPNTAAAVLEPNLTSIALWLETPTHVVLLGGDLERHEEFGWSRAITETADTRGERRATLLKVPHHGSEDADDDAMWDSLMSVDAFGVVTPFRTTLPSTSDLQRLHTRVSQLKLAASPHWSSWANVAGIIESSIPGATVDAREEIGYLTYEATATGWDVAEGAL